MDFAKIAKQIIHTFISSCGFSFLFFYFYDLYFTKDTAKAVFWAIFGIMLIINIGIEEANNGWFCPETKQPAATVGSQLGKAVIVEKTNTSEYNQKVNAVHEAGHAVMAQLRKAETFEVQMLYPTPRVLTAYKLGDAEDVKSMILVKYAGAVAEELVFGYFHAGCFGSADSDFISATELIKGYIVMTNPEVSKSMLESELSVQIVALSKKFYHMAKEMLTRYKSSIISIADILVEKESMSKDEIAQIIKERGSI